MALLARKWAYQGVRQMQDYINAEETIRYSYDLTLGSTEMHRLTLEQSGKYNTAAILVTRCLQKHGAPCCYRNSFFPKGQNDRLGPQQRRMSPCNLTVPGALVLPPVDENIPTVFC